MPEATLTWSYVVQLSRLMMPYVGKHTQMRNKDSGMDAAPLAEWAAI